MLTETSSSRYTERTRKNIDCSDGTLIINFGELAGGTAATAEYAKRVQKPLLIIQLEEPLKHSRDVVRQWIVRHAIQTLNVAGPHESKCPGIHEDAMDLLSHIL
jgi:hypothetical protein